jgi:SAM-dependent methyltransferase
VARGFRPPLISGVIVLERLPPPNLAIWGRFSADHIARYAFAAPYAAGGHVLDAGTGVGYGAALLKSFGAERVIGIDNANEAIADAQAHFASEGVEFRHDDCQTLSTVPFGLDLICNFENLEHLDNPNAFLAAAATKLADTGTLLCSTPDRSITPEFLDGKPANPFHRHEWYREELRLLLANHFSSVVILAQVQTWASLGRQAAASRLADTLNDQLSNVLMNPVLRIARKAGEILQLRWNTAAVGPLHQLLAGLAGPSAADFPIVPENVASIYGQPWCHVAICSMSRR